MRSSIGLDHRFTGFASTLANAHVRAGSARFPRPRRKSTRANIFNDGYLYCRICFRFTRGKGNDEHVFTATWLEAGEDFSRRSSPRDATAILNDELEWCYYGVTTALRPAASRRASHELGLGHAEGSGS